MIRSSIRSQLTGALIFNAAALGVGLELPAHAQTSAPAAGQQAPAEEPEFVQRPLTDDLIQKFIDAQDGIGDISADAPQGDSNTPDPKVQARLDAAVRKFGFKSYDDYQDVGNTIDFLFEAFDPATKTFVGHEAMIKRQIAELQAEKTVLEAERHAQIAELEDTLKSLPPVKYPDDIPKVAKFYDKLAKVFDDSP
jgi:hypothetical protein